MKILRDPLLWLLALFIALLMWLPHSAPLFSALFPQLPRPVYLQESFIALTLAHFSLVALSDTPVTILDPKCTAKTFPDYFEQLARISTPA